MPQLNQHFVDQQGQLMQGRWQASRAGLAVSQILQQRGFVAFVRFAQ